MTEPVPEVEHDVDAEVDVLLAGILAAYGLDKIDDARSLLRRNLMLAWYDGQSAAWNASRRVGAPRQNPWLRSVK